MVSRRIERFNEQLKREITEIVRNEVKDPRIGMVTVTAVEAAADFSVARVHISVFGEDVDKEESLEGLHAAAPFIRTELSKRLRVRRVPELRFELDRSIEYAMKIERLLGEALPDRGTESAPQAEEEDSPNGETDER
jgi:ribosome-binding factor A